MWRLVLRMLIGLVMRVRSILRLKLIVLSLAGMVLTLSVRNRNPVCRLRVL